MVPAPTTCPAIKLNYDGLDTFLSKRKRGTEFTALVPEAPPNGIGPRLTETGVTTTPPSRWPAGDRRHRIGRRTYQRRDRARPSVRRGRGCGSSRTSGHPLSL